MTKVMASVGALTFYEEGKLPLNAPISNWLPQFKEMKVGQIDADGKLNLVPAKNPITVQDLMRHTNGLTYGGRGSTPVHKLYPAGSAPAAVQYTAAEFIDKLASNPLLYEPGTTWDYGFGIDVLGIIEEKIANKSLGAVMQERIWNKVVMPNTTFDVAEKDRSRLAQPLPIDPLTGKPQKVDILNQKVKFDCGGSCAYSTAGDYIRFGQMLLNGGSLEGKRVLGPQTVAFMTSNHLNKDIKNNVGVTEPGRVGYGFGLGVAVRTDRGLSAINGNIGDFTWNGANGTIFWADPKEQMVVVMMAVAPGEIRKVHREQLNAVIYGALEK
jgi:CubicO group peptidase (beta-lactamase class C family)